MSFGIGQSIPSLVRASLVLCENHYRVNARAVGIDVRQPWKVDVIEFAVVWSLGPCSFAGVLTSSARAWQRLLEPADCCGDQNYGCPR